MKKQKLFKFFTTLLCISFLHANNLQPAMAAETPDTDTINHTENTQEPLYLSAPCFTMENFDVNTNTDYSMKKDKSKITWTESYHNSEDNISITYDFQIAKKSDFSGAKTLQTSKPSIILKKSQFGKHGGIFYVRVRANYNNMQFSDWSEPKELTYIKIDKTNFPGLYQLLKNGGKKASYNEKTNEYYTEKVIYDKNGDTWLDPNEINLMWGLFTLTESYQKNGKWYTKDATKVSSLKGIEYLKNVSCIQLSHYSGKTIDCSKNKGIYSIYVTGISSDQITVISPTAKTVSVETPFNNDNFNKIDLSKCDKAVSISAYGNNKTKTLILPKNKKNLKELSISDLETKTLNLNPYTNLQLLYVYKCDTTKVQLTKCQNLRYLYFWHCDKIKNLDLSKNKKLVGLSVYKSSGLTKNTIKGYKFETKR